MQQDEDALTIWDAIIEIYATDFAKHQLTETCKASKEFDYFNMQTFCLCINTEDGT